MKIVEGFETLSELDLLAGTIYGEARGECHDGRVGVGLVVRNRVAQPGWWGRNWREVILREKQFSCWSDQNANAIADARYSDPRTWRECLDVAEEVYLGRVSDFLGGPTHYHAVSVFPEWAKKLKRLAQIGGHVFYR